LLLTSVVREEATPARVFFLFVALFSNTFRWVPQ
jgi:hypothetical protein